MASFLEKFPSVTIHEYIYKLPIPYIIMMIADSPRIIYGKGRVISKRVTEKDKIASALNKQMDGKPKTLNEILGKTVEKKEYQS